MSDETIHTGGCLCGAVRYEARGEPIDASHCHCDMCRRASGAGLMTFVSFEAGQVTWTKGAPSIYKSSSFASRGFCPNCGSQLTFQFDSKPNRLSLSAGTLDDPEKIHPTHHLFAEEAVSWMKMEDGLPRRQGGSGNAG